MSERKGPIYIEVPEDWEPPKTSPRGEIGIDIDNWDRKPKGEQK